MALTKKQEAFAQLVAKGESQSEAYRQAFDAGEMSDGALSSSASQLANSQDVATRIKLLREGATARSVSAAAYTIDMAMGDAEKAIELAMVMGQAPAIVAAAKLKSQLAGHLAEKKGDIPAAALDEADVQMIQDIRAALVAKAKANAQAAELMGEVSTDVLVSDSDRPVMRLPPAKVVTA